jgi:hypothetical protein
MKEKLRKYEVLIVKRKWEHELILHEHMSPKPERKENIDKILISYG